jgi:hypothetical protein
VSLCTLLRNVLLQHRLIRLSGLSCPVVLVTNLASKVSSAFTKTTTQISFSEAHPRAESRLHR